MATLHRPRLGPVAAELIDLVREQGPAGGGVPLVLVVQMFGFRLAPEVVSYLESRGDIGFHPRDERSGTARNLGDPKSFETPAVRLILPDLLQGRFEVDADSLLLRFDPATSVQLKKAFLGARIAALHLSRDKARLEVHGPLPDFHFTW